MRVEGIRSRTDLQLKKGANSLRPSVYARRSGPRCERRFPSVFDDQVENPDHDRRDNQRRNEPDV